MKRIVFLIIATLLVIGLVLPGCGGGTTEPKSYTFTDAKIKVAIAGPMTYVQGEHMKWGAELAQDEINALPGKVTIDGTAHTIELVVVDTKEISPPTPAYPGIQLENAITVQGAHFALGGFRTESTFGMVETAMDNETLMFICGSATGDVLKLVNQNPTRYKYLFRGTPINEIFLLNNNMMMLAMAGMYINGAILTGTGGALNVTPRVAFLAENLLWTAVPRGAIAATIAGLGWNLTTTELVTDTATDITTQLNNIKATKPHMIFTLLSGPVGVTYGNQVASLNIPALTIGINVESQDPGYWDATEYSPGNFGAEYQITLTTITPNVAQAGNLTTDFFNAFVAKTGGAPIYTAGSYDMIYGLKAALEGVPFTDDAGVKSVLASDLIAWYENPANARLTTSGTVGYYTSADQPLVDGGVPAYAHDVKYGPQWVTGLGAQWQSMNATHGKIEGIWPKVEYSAASQAICMFAPFLGLTWTGFEHTGTTHFLLDPSWVPIWIGWGF